MSRNLRDIGRQSFANSLPKRLQLITDGATSLLSRHPDKTIIEAGALAAHSMIGAAPMFGREDLGELARSVDQHFTKLHDLNTALNTEDIAQLQAAIARLHQAATTTPPLTQSTTATKTKQPSAPSPLPENRVLLIEDDEAFGAELSMLLATFNWEVVCARGAEAALAQLEKNEFCAVIADIMLPEGPLAGTELFKKMPQQLLETTPPVLFISSRWDWEARLAAVRANAAAYLPKPIDISRLIDVLENLTGRSETQNGRILLVDDDAILAEHFRQILAEAGHIPMVVTNPTQLLKTIPLFAPELIIMDLHMPGCSGIEISRVLRQDDANISIPILFLSSDSARGYAQQAIIAGADDFLLKPISDEWFVSAINARIQRVRAINNLAMRDSMTGLLNHLATQQFLEMELNAAARESTPLCFAMIDIDHFKLVNDTHGHPAGDKVIRGIAHLLKQRLRRSDAVGRYGGEEFAIVLPDTSLAAGKGMLDTIREQFAGLRFNGSEASFSVTMSAGICKTLPGETTESAIRRADEALYVAKRAGRNRIIAAE